MKIIYKPIKDFPGYRVGNDGTVWSCIKRRRLKGKWGGTFSFLSKKWKRLKPCKSWQGRLVVGLFPGNKQKLIHRLVLESFIGNCPSGKQACHFPDRSPLNNHLSNLRWATPKENHADAVAHGTKGFGENSPRRKHKTIATDK